MNKRTVKRDWVTCMSMIEYLYNFGYTVFMSNHKRWGVYNNDTKNYFTSKTDKTFPELDEDFRGHKFTPKQSNLEDCCDLLDFILEKLEDIEGEEFDYLLDETKPYIFNLNQFTNNDN